MYLPGGGGVVGVGPHSYINISLKLTYEHVKNTQKNRPTPTVLFFTNTSLHMPDDATEGVAEHSYTAATISQLVCPSYSLYVQLLWYPMYYVPEGIKGRVSPVQRSKPYSILIGPPTQDSKPGGRYPPPRWMGAIYFFPQFFLNFSSILYSSPTAFFHPGINYYEPL